MTMAQSPAWPGWCCNMPGSVSSGWLSPGSVSFGQPWWVMGGSPWPSSAQCHGGGLKRSKLTSPGDGGPKSIMLRCWYRSPVRGLKKKRVKWKRAEGVEGPSPGAVFGGNGRTLMGTKGPYLLPGEILIPGFNRPLQSQAVNWATAGLLADLLACWRAFSAAPRRQQPQAT